tara:strand:+ start:1651 stop:1992 length:342 start_codon:yes stop_codon:yes gene_type:complete
MYINKNSERKIMTDKKYIQIAVLEGIRLKKSEYKDFENFVKEQTTGVVKVLEVVKEPHHYTDHIIMGVEDINFNSFIVQRLKLNIRWFDDFIDNDREHFSDEIKNKYRRRKND